MQPFNLEQALAGKPFTNDKGWTVEDWHYFKGANSPISVKWKENGWTVDYTEPQLFMLPEKKKVWIVVYETMEGDFHSFVCECVDELVRRRSQLGTLRMIEIIEKEYEL
jgi:hypothetical protein